MVYGVTLVLDTTADNEEIENSFADIARLLSDFFRDLDVVPSDVVAGLVLLRKFQKIEREAIVKQHRNDTYEYLSGVPVTSQTQFLALNDPQHLDHFQAVIHYMHFALAAYGWPMFLMTNSKTGVCQLCARLRSQKDPAVIIKDNCCHCNYAALRKMVEVGEVEVVYATYHVDVGETPFFVAVDYSKKKVVLSIRGSCSLDYPGMVESCSLEGPWMVGSCSLEGPWTVRFDLLNALER
uniref:Uncharacterized protein n=1 Tax=Timema shepardi TaxID=629360 RepID=A0A7R9AQQ0_TIMSH|nr:unnamed protein product [Timema shepardi]